MAYFPASPLFGQQGPHNFPHSLRPPSGRRDILVVYLSGHGAMSSTNRDLYYYLTMDARTFDIERDAALKNVSTVSSAQLNPPCKDRQSLNG